jgi:hypothetical protein
MVLLDSASARWGGGNAVARFAEDWNDLDRDLPPAPVMERLDRAAGSRRARLARMNLLLDARKDADAPLSGATREAVLALAAEGNTDAQLAAYDDLVARKQVPEAVAMLRRAAAQDDADAMERLAYRMIGAAGVPRDRAGGLAADAQGRGGGDSVAMRWMGWYAGGQRQWKEAEAWQLSAMSYDNWRAMVDLLETYQRPGATAPTPERYKEMYETLVKYVDQPEARRSYAAYLVKAPAKDAARARALLEQDARAGDARSALLLGEWMLDGKFGKADATAAMAWINAAMVRAPTPSTRSPTTCITDSARRRRAIARSRTKRDLVAKGHDGARNNLAWWLCNERGSGVCARRHEGSQSCARSTRQGSTPGPLDHPGGMRGATACSPAEAVAHQVEVAKSGPRTRRSSIPTARQSGSPSYRESKPFVESRATELTD